jgi:2-phosphosulfolactate phosphatase
MIRVVEVKIVEGARPIRPGTVVVVDVIRAFSSAAAALAEAATRVLCVARVADAHALQAEIPRAILAGEVGGLPPPRFEAGNSPRELLASAVAGRPVVLLSENGTPALLRAEHADVLLAAAAVNASATVRWVRRHHPSKPVTIVCTTDGDDDWACAEHMSMLFRGRLADPAATSARIRGSIDVHLERWLPFHPADVCRRFREDAEACAVVDAYDFAMVGLRHGRAIELRAAATSGHEATRPDEGSPE